MTRPYQVLRDKLRAKRHARIVKEAGARLNEQLEAHDKGFRKGFKAGFIQALDERDREYFESRFEDIEKHLN